MESKFEIGIKGIRKLRKVQESYKTTNASNVENYFAESIDYLISRCITHILAIEPPTAGEILREILSFLSGKQQGCIKKAEFSNKKEKKFYLVTKVGPIISKLIVKLAAIQPKNPREFLILEITELLSNSSTEKPKEITLDKSSSMYNNKCNIQIAVLGLNNSGKTSILNSIQGNVSSQVKPTIGFRPVNFKYEENITISFYDLGGSKKIRDIWSQYYHDIHGIIYVIDGSSEELSEIETSLELLSQTINNSMLLNKPMALFINKDDLKETLNASSITEILNSSHPVFITRCCGIGVINNDEKLADQRIVDEIENLIAFIIKNYESLNSRVIEDTKTKQLEETRRRLQRERNVLKNKIIAAFIDFIDPVFIQESLDEFKVNKQDIFEESEGLLFLASEIDLKVEDLCDTAKLIAKLVGYQRLALQMIGGLYNPISKKKQAMSWEEILFMVNDIRKELNLQ